MQSQLRDSLANFTMMVLLMEATSSLELQQAGDSLSIFNHKYITVIESVMLLVLLILEATSCIGLKTNWLDTAFQGIWVREEDNHSKNKRLSFVS